MTHVNAAGRSSRPDFSVDVFDEAEDTYRGFDPREGEGGGRGPLILALAGGVLVVFGAVVWNTYANGLRDPDDALPIVRAQAGDYREPGEAQPAMVAAENSRRVYADRALPPGETDVDVSPVASTWVADANDPVLKGEGPVDLRPASIDASHRATQSDPGAVSELAVLPDPALGFPVVDEVVADLEGLRGTLDRSGEAQTVASLAPVPVEASPLSERAPAEAAQAGYVFTPDGAFLVQVGAMRSEEAALAAWETGITKYPAFFRGATRLIQRADLGAKGVYFRVRVGGFATRDKASEYCEALKAEGGNCIVVER